MAATSTVCAGARRHIGGLRPVAATGFSTRARAGATASANLYSLVQTCRINGVEQYAYLNYLFTHLVSASTAEDFEALLPWNVKRVLARAPPD
jgi:hypothetical protein